MKASSPEMRLNDAPLSPELTTSVSVPIEVQEKILAEAWATQTGSLNQGETSLDAEADSASPEAEAFAKEIGGVAVRAEDALLTTAGAGTDQLEAHANNPLAHAEDFVLKTGTNKNGKTTRSVYAVMPDGTQKRTSYDNMLIERGYDPHAYKEHKAEFKDVPSTDTPQEVESVAEPTATVNMFEDAQNRDKARAAESVDAILAKSSGVNLAERIKLARAEKQWRTNVREVNKSVVKQEIRDAKTKLDIAKDTYGFRGRQVLRKLERRNMRTEIDKRHAEGKLNFVQARLAKVGAYSKAKELVAERSEGKIAAAEALVESARSDKRAFLNANGRRSNTLRKNYNRVSARVSSDGYYQGAGYLSKDRASSSEMWSSDEYVKKRAEARKKQEELRKARAAKAAAKK